MMKLKILAMIVAACMTLTAAAQPQQTDQLSTIAQKVLAAYNGKNYKGMRKPWIWWTKPIVTAGKLQKGFEPYHTRYGRFTVDTIIVKSRYQCVAKVRGEKEQATTVYFSFLFNNHAHLQGFGETYPELTYRARTARPINVPAFTAYADSVILKKYTKNPVTGFTGSIAVLQDGVPVYERHVGYGNREQKTPLNDTTLFELASVSKQFTAVAILLLQRQGKLQLTDTIQQFFPQLPYRGITLAHLLAHTSGMPDYEKMLEQRWDRTKFATNEDVITMLGNHQPKVLFAPGTRWEYSNTGYVLLASVIEKVSGKSYGEFLKETLFTPLGMSRSRVYNTRRAGGEVLDNYAWGYVYDKQRAGYVLPDSLEKYDEVRYQDAITGDGTVNSCLRDMEIWANELLHPRVLPADLPELLWRDNKLLNGESTGYGYGYMVTGGGATEPICYHTGGWPGYCTLLLTLPKQKKQVILLSNNEYNNFSRIADDLCTLMLQP